LLSLRRARVGLGVDIDCSWSARLGASIGRLTLLAPSRIAALFSCICRVDSKKDSRCVEPVELLTRTRRVRCTSSGGLCSLRNGLSVKMRLRNRGILAPVLCVLIEKQECSVKWKDCRYVFDVHIQRTKGSFRLIKCMHQGLSGGIRAVVRG
jgi:hypothetical protein